MFHNQKVKRELIEQPSQKNAQDSLIESVLIDITSTDSDSGSDSDSSSDDNGAVKRSRGPNGDEVCVMKKRKRLDGSGVVLPPGFLDPLPPASKEVVQSSLAVVPANGNGGFIVEVEKCKQFWKAGDYEANAVGDWEKSSGGMDRVRVHPRFLHSNATSHKWVLGAFAELLDNALDEAVHGATYANIDMMKSEKDGSRMLLIEDNGGGMGPDKMRQCMSLGYSLKSKVANTIGQYGNGFKTSTMRLGADVIVFSRCSGKDGKRPTQSIGLLSYTFLRSTGKEDIVVPMIDYEKVGLDWKKIIRSSSGYWSTNVETIVQWSPFLTEAELFRQFNQMKDHGTRIIIYNLWEDDQGLLELDFDSDKHDIQIRGVNRDDKNIQMAQQFPNSRHFLTYRHSLRSYASILYLRVPPGFRIILRQKDVEHHNIINDMMMTQEVTYRPNPSADGVPKDTNMVAVVTMGFVKDAKAHIDVQGFNVYHKNRLIKPFWRVWNAAGSDGRGVIGVLEANFVEPAHDKQGFERTIVLSRLETKLVQIQKQYWSTHCHKIGYAARRNKKFFEDRESSPDYIPQTTRRNSTVSSSKTPVSELGKSSSYNNLKHGGRSEVERHSKTGEKSNGSGENIAKTPMKFGKEANFIEPLSPSLEEIGADDLQNGTPDRRANGGSRKELSSYKKLSFRSDGSPRVESHTLGHIEAEGDDVNGKRGSSSSCNSQALEQLKQENRELRDRLNGKEEELLEMQHELQTARDRCRSLEAKLMEATHRVDEINKEQESLIDIFSEERGRRDIEEENLRKKLKDASNTIQELLDKVRVLEKTSSYGRFNC